MSFLVNPPRAIDVETDEEGIPRHIHGDPLIGPVRPVQHWIADLDWWNRPVYREYWKVLLRDRLLCEIYLDRELGGAWFVERVYD
jgi:hypothetical protein